MITITPRSAAEAEIGASVCVLEAEAGRPSLFAAGDVDALMDVRDGAKVAATTAAA